MKHFADVVLNRDFNLRKELLTIEQLYTKGIGKESMYDAYSEAFLKWNLRSNYIDPDTYTIDFGVAKIIDKCYEGLDITIDEFIYYCEFIYNTMVLPEVSSNRYASYVRTNISNVIEKLNYKTHYFNGIWHIVEKSVLVSEAADIVQDNYELGESIYSFNYRETKGNIHKKADTLCRLYKYIESITPQVKQYGYFGLLEDIKDLSNRLDVRHAPTLKQTTVIEGMGKDEYESWLDELFKLSLSLIILVDYTSKKKDIKELKCELG